MRLLIYAFAMIFACADSSSDAQALIQDDAQALFEDFETPELVATNPGESEPDRKYLWSQYAEGGDRPGLARLTSDYSYNGNQSISVTITPGAKGDFYLQFRPTVGSVKTYAREMKPEIEWKLDYFDRIKFWVLLPSTLPKAPLGQKNAQFATYTRSLATPTNTYESENGHWYHHYNLFPTGQWHQIIVDLHPNAQRGVAGRLELGNLPYPTGDAGYNYFDVITRFYMTVYYKASEGLPFPATMYADYMEFYKELSPENIDQVYSLHGVYVPSDNKVVVGWMRHKEENKVRHEVRYAFQSIHEIGWSQATQAPDGMVKPEGWDGYNGMEWSTSQIDLKGRSHIYIGIKPENATLFRQIEVPIRNVSGELQEPHLFEGEPFGSLPPGVQSTDLSLKTDVDCDCRFDMEAGKDFDAMANTFSTTDGKLHSEVIEGLQDGAEYAYYARCRSRAQVIANTSDYLISFSVDEFPTSITETDPDVTPTSIVLNQNYPNPFNPQTKISFFLPTTQAVSLMVFDLYGRLVRTLLNKQIVAKGLREVSWDGQNSDGRLAASGIYIYRMFLGNQAISKKMLLLH